MDEMDKYRERMERRRTNRRNKNERRQAIPQQPKSTDWFFWIDIVFFAAMAVAYYFANQN